MLSVTSKNLCNESLISSSTATTIGNNDNPLIDILYCLPLKSLCAFKTVSKQWQSLISDPYFERNYNLQSRHRRLSMPALFLKKRSTKGGDLEELETVVMDERNGNDYVPFNTSIAVRRGWLVYFEQSCNGLVLCTVHDGHGSGYYYTTRVIYNPSMRHCKTLPSPPFRKATGVPRVLSVSIAFDPAKSSHYEVVAVCKTDRVALKDVYYIEIYSSKTDSWRKAGDPFPFSSQDTLSESGVYWNGSVHWINQWSATLHYFDIGCELVKTIAMPTKPHLEGYYYDKTIVYFNECRGHVHLMQMCEDDMPYIDIWEMHTDYTGWNVKYYVDLTPLTTVYPNMVRGHLCLRSIELNVLLLEEGDGDSSRLILLIEKDKVISFNLKNKSLKKMYDVNPDVWVNGFHYVETLTHA